MDDLHFMDGLLWYLKTRNWAFEKIYGMSKGLQEPLDLQMYHYLYFSNLLGAIDYLKDYLHFSEVITNFETNLGEQNYCYLRELRNSIVHRGLNPAPFAGITDEGHLFVFCPPVVHDRKMSKSYRCSFAYTVELAEYCKRISNKVIFQALDGCGFFNRNDGPTSKEEALDARSVYLQCILQGEKPITPAMLENISKVTTRLRIEELRTILDASLSGEP